VLDVCVAADGQPQAAFQAPPLEHDAAIRSGHALAETVHAHAPAYLGLVSTFGCHSLTPKKTNYCGLRRNKNRLFIQVRTLQQTMFFIQRRTQRTPNGELSAGVFEDGLEL
jgi:hypothetical protein